MTSWRKTKDMKKITLVLLACLIAAPGFSSPISVLVEAVAKATRKGAYKAAAHPADAAAHLIVDHKAAKIFLREIEMTITIRHSSFAIRPFPTPYFFTAIVVEYCVSSHISFNTPSAAVFSTEIRN